MRPIKRIVIHCAAVPNGRKTTVEDITRWHKERGFDTIGYHWVIYTDGTVHAGRPEEMVGAHVSGYNTTSIGVCMIGTDKYSPEQWVSLSELVRGLLARYPTIKEILGHGDFPDVHKTCPGFSVKAWVAGRFAAPQDHIL